MKLKNCSFIVFIAIGITTSLRAQETTETPVLQTISIQKGQQQVTHDKAYFQQRIQELDIMLSAIDEKVRYVQSNEDEHKNALENGWYKQMEENKVHAKRIRQEYLIKMNSMR